MQPTSLDSPQGPDPKASASVPILSVRGLSVSRQGAPGERGYALSVPNFTAERGARIGLIGESGSGKTTFLELLGLLAWPDQVAAFDFAPVAELGAMDLRPALIQRQSNLLSELRAQTMGFVLQDGGLLPYLTVRENAELARSLSGRAKDAALLHDLAKCIGISDYLDRYQSALSGGQRQRAAVLRSLVAGAPLLVADEPTAALDPQTSQDVLRAIVESGSVVGATLIVASHNLSLLEDFDFQIMRVQVEEREETRFAELVPA